MSLELKGKIIQVLPLESGEGNSGKAWKKQSFILEFKDGNYEKKVSIQAWGDMCDKLPKAGSEITAHINVESREYNSKWYTDVKLWKFEGGTAAGTNSSPATGSTNEPSANDLEINDLPF